MMEDKIDLLLIMDEWIIKILACLLEICGLIVQTDVKIDVYYALFS